MASSIGLAIKKAWSPEFELAVGLDVVRPTPTPTDPAIAAFLARHDLQASIRRVVFGLAKRWTCDFTFCEEAVQQALTDLYEQQRELFLDPPDAWMNLLFAVAHHRLIDIRKDTGQTRSLDSLWEEGGDRAFAEARAVSAPSLEGVDEDARLIPPPRIGERWERMEMTGAAQRFRDTTGRPPTSEECRRHWRALDLPPLSQIYREFGTFNEFLLEAGMTPRFTARRRALDAVQAAKACVSWRWRHGCWPGKSEIGQPDTELPSKLTCERNFGGCEPIDIQLGVEVILTPEEIARQW